MKSECELFQLNTEWSRKLYRIHRNDHLTFNTHFSAENRDIQIKKRNQIQRSNLGLVTKVFTPEHKSCGLSTLWKVILLLLLLDQSAYIYSVFFPKLWKGPVPDQLWKIVSFLLKIVKKSRRFFRKLWKKNVFVKSVSISILNDII